jgi:UDP-2,3-diacylglucosamine pyrophosphatase LpxH
VLHGDDFDVVTKYHRWLAILGDHAYAILVRLNVMLSTVRRHLRVPGYWSLAGYAKRRVKSAVSFICDFEESVVRHVKDRGFDGVICGHIHAAALRDIEGVRYLNCGDWVDSCTAVVEHHDGRMELVQWTRELSLSQGAAWDEPEEALPQRAPELPARMPAGTREPA